MGGGGGGGEGERYTIPLSERITSREIKGKGEDPTIGAHTQDVAVASLERAWG